MSRNSFFLLTLATFVVVVIAVTSTVKQTNRSVTIGDRDSAFPKLVANINDVGAIEIFDKENRFTILGEGDSWGILEKANYRVPRDKIRNFILELANLKLVERKTKIEDRYSRLEVEEPQGKDSNSRGVRVMSTNGDLLASAIIGRRKYFLYVDGRGGTYLRREGERQAWLAEGETHFGSAPSDWLDRSVFELDPNNVKSYNIVHPDGTVLRGIRETPGSKFVLDGMSSEREFKTDNEAERLAFVVEKFEFADIERTPYQNFDGFSGQRHNAQYEFFDGLVVTFDVITLPKPKGASKFDEPPRWAKASASIAPDTPEDLRIKLKDAMKKLNEKLLSWEFLLEELDGIRTTKRIEDMLKPLEDS